MKNLVCTMLVIAVIVFTFLGFKYFGVETAYSILYTILSWFMVGVVYFTIDEVRD